MRALVATGIALAISAGALIAGSRNAQPAAQAGVRVSELRVLGSGWLRLRVPDSWSARGVTGGTVVATPIAPGWTRAVSLTVAPFALPQDLGRHETSPSIPARSYQIWVSALRSSRRGTPPGAAPMTVTRRDRAASPPPGVGIEFARTLEIGDRVIRAVVSMDREAGVDAALEDANRVLRTLCMIE